MNVNIHMEKLSCNNCITVLEIMEKSEHFIANNYN